MYSVYKLLLLLLLQWFLSVELAFVIEKYVCIDDKGVFVCCNVEIYVQLSAQPHVGILAAECV